MKIFGASNDPIIFTKCSSQAEIERFSARVCDDASSLLDNELARSVILTQNVSKAKNGRRVLCTHIFSRYPVPVGILRYTPPPSFDRARQPYFAWLSMRTGGLVIDMKEEIVEDRECEECSAS
jgi:hypothetical protein